MSNAYLAHIVRLVHTVISVAVLAEADKYCIDGHLWKH